MRRKAIGVLSIGTGGVRTLPSEVTVLDNRTLSRGKPVRSPLLGLAVVRGRSMEPTLHEGDRLLISYGARPMVGRLAVVRLPGRPVAVKRVTGQVDGSWWVERDNPDEGVDSWLVGAIAPDDVVARVLGRVWPLPPRRL
jgi:phage repressor protein C with HTH and peptisase S24 domain